MEYSNYYGKKLYPIQIEVLKNLKRLELPFYLTGGTAVSRGYFHHRYSDDLDLFVNNDKNFFSNIDKALNSLECAGFIVNVSETSSSCFSRVFINQNINGLNNNGLKIDFVNDIDVHFGSITNTSVYYRTDSILNILTNKYTALYRLSVKDVVDICEISKHYSFNWKDIIDKANQKEIGIDLKEVVEILGSYSEEDFSRIRWIKQPNLQLLKNNIECIAFDMINLKDNSLSINKVPKKHMSISKDENMER